MSSMDALPLQTEKPIQTEETKPIVAYLSPPRLFFAVVKTGVDKAQEPWWKAFWLGALGGAYLGLGATFFMYCAGQVPAILDSDPGLQHLLAGAFGLPMGLGLVIISGAELYTANCAYLSAAVFEGKTTVWSMLYHLLFCFWGNLAGSLIVVGFILGSNNFEAEPANTVAVPYAVKFVTSKATAGFRHVVAKAFLCNWLVCLACYQSIAAQDVFGKLAAIFFPVMAFVAIGFDHLVANMFIIPFGMCLGAPITVGHYIVYSMIPSIIGNTASAVFMISFSYAMCYGTLADSIRGKLQNAGLPMRNKSEKELPSSNPPSAHAAKDDSAHHRI